VGADMRAREAHQPRLLRHATGGGDSHGTAARIIRSNGATVSFPAGKDWHGDDHRDAGRTAARGDASGQCVAVAGAARWLPSRG
jgi:hypothetical protein